MEEEPKKKAKVTAGKTAGKKRKAPVPDEEEKKEKVYQIAS